MKNKHLPPRKSLWLMLNFVPSEDRPALRQAIIEIYEHLTKTKGRGTARLWLAGQLIRSLPALFINSVYWSIVMVKNYMKITLRNLRKQKLHSFINITGLAIGIACCLIIFLWIQGELGYDRLHDNSQELFRVVQESPQGGQIFHVSVTPSGLAAYLENQYPEILYSSRYITTKAKVGREEDYLRESVALVDESFLEMFSFPLLDGKLQAVLQDPYSIAISETIKKKYFADENPLGKTLRIGEMGTDMTVTGVLQDIPKNSHMEFECLIPFKILGESGANMNDWTNNNYSTYVQLQKNVPYTEVEAKISGVIQKHVPRASSTLYLQPVTKIHLYSLGGGGPITYLTIFAGMAIFILLIASINYMNLSTARSANRAREVGIRQVVGANRPQLIKQFMGESILFSVIAMIFGLLLVHFLLPTFSRLAEKPITIEYTSSLFLLLLGLTLFTGILSGIYPAFVLSSFRAVRVLKGTFKSRSGSAVFRRFLVVFQFSLSIFLIIGTLFVFRQMDFLMKKELGYNKENIVCLPMRYQLSRNFTPFKTELLKNPNILSMTRANTTPDIKQSSVAGYDFSWDGRQEGNNFPGIHVMGVDADYQKTFDIKMAEGRFFSEKIPADLKDSCVINEAAAAAMGLESPLGIRVYWDDFIGKIIGVIKDFHFSSLHDEIEPLMMRMHWSMDNICIRIRPENISGSIGHIKSTQKELFPGETFEYKFLDARLSHRYLAEKRMKKILIFATIIAILISCLGLLGLASFTAEQKTKEIGIRKVLGSSVAGIIVLLSQEFMKWVLLANLIAWPAAYLAVHSWLRNFAYRINIGWQVFLLSGFLALVISLFTVCYQALKAALANPVDSMRYE
ncbi:MAG: ABC transporter permease [Candidatus Aminicenantes bacterium]|nr:ABC transporter permease [Candidatus Aminicenantes bacterium]